MKRKINYISVLLMVAMFLVGSLGTYAWFTASQESRNIIKVGSFILNKNGNLAFEDTEEFRPGVSKEIKDNGLTIKNDGTIPMNLMVDINLNSRENEIIDTNSPDMYLINPQIFLKDDTTSVNIGEDYLYDGESWMTFNKLEEFLNKEVLKDKEFENGNCFRIDGHIKLHKNAGEQEGYKYNGDTLTVTLTVKAKQLEADSF